MCHERTSLVIEWVTFEIESLVSIDRPLNDIHSISGINVVWFLSSLSGKKQWNECENHVSSNLIG